MSTFLAKILCYGHVAILGPASNEIKYYPNSSSGRPEIRFQQCIAIECQMQVWDSLVCGDIVLFW